MGIVVTSQIKRKISGNVPFVVAGAFIIIYISLGAVYLQKQGESRDLDYQVSLQRVLLQNLPPDTEQLTAQFTEAKAAYEYSLTTFPTPGQSSDIYGVLVAMSRTSNAEVISIDASPATTTEEGETILPYSLVVQGSQSDILNYISSLIQAGKLLPGLELTGIDIQQPASPGGTVILKLQLVVHTWAGAL